MPQQLVYKTPAAKELVRECASRLLDEWVLAIRLLEDSGEMVKHWAFKDLVEIGKPVVPLALESLREDGPKELIYLLIYIEKENGPFIPEQYRENWNMMRCYWIKWGLKKELID